MDGNRVDLEELVEGIEGGINSLRQIMADQRPPVLDRGLMEALDEMKRDYELSEIEGAKVEWVEKDRVTLHDDIATTLYRIAQEAFMNARKHAYADRILLTLKYDGDVIKMIIKDEGVGFDSPDKERHFGIMGMKERAFMIGADIDIVSNPGEGTEVIVELKHD